MNKYNFIAIVTIVAAATLIAGMVAPVLAQGGNSSGMNMNMTGGNSSSMGGMNMNMSSMGGASNSSSSSGSQ